MARFLFLSRGTYGDVNPFLAIGRVLSGRGHEVCVVVNEYFREHVTSAGLDFLPSGTVDAYLEEQTANTDLLRRRTGRLPMSEWGKTSSRRRFQQWLVPEINRSFDVIREYARAGNVTIAARGLTFAARAAQEKLGLPVATIYLTPFEAFGMSWPGLGALPLSRASQRAVYEKVVSRVVDGIFSIGYRAALDEIYGHIGLRPDGFVTRWVESPLLAIALWPSWYMEPGPAWSPGLQTPGFVMFDSGVDTIDAETAEFLSRDEAKVLLFTQGTFRRGEVGAFLETCAAVSTALGRRAIVLADEPAPQQVSSALLVKRYVPLGKLLPHVAAIVHHGGMGTGARALHAGVPQLVVPVMGDQPWNAGRLVSFGVARTMSPQKFNAQSGVVEAMRDLLTDDSIRDACAERRAMVDPDAALRATSDALEGLATESIR